MKKRCLLYSFLILLPLFGLKAGSTGGYAGAFLRMGLGARAMGMGNCGVATTTGAAALYYNPAGIANLKHRNLGLSYYFLSLDRSFHYTGLAVPIRPSAGAAISWIHAGVDDIQGRSSTGQIDDSYSTGESSIMLSFANRFFPKIAIGINLKLLLHSLLEANATGIGFDLGILYQPWQKLRLGIELKDIAAAYNWNTQPIFDEKGTTYTEKFPLQIRAGAAFSPVAFVTIASDITYSDTENLRFHIGGEYVYQDLIAVRAGWDHNQPAFGFGFMHKLFHKISATVDYSAVFGIAGEGCTHVFSWDFAF